jgi:hypothetical protein
MANHSPEDVESSGDDEAESNTLSLGAGKALGPHDEPDCYEPPYRSHRLGRKYDGAIDSDLNSPWD